jgi:hypothetical protein
MSLNYITMGVFTIVNFTNDVVKFVNVAFKFM